VQPASNAPPVSGFFSVSLTAEVSATLARLAGPGPGGPPRVVEVSGVQLAVVTDPDGVSSNSDSAANRQPRRPTDPH